MPNIDTVFVDLDGVLVDFVDSARRALIAKGVIEPISHEDMMAKWPRGNFEFHDVFNVPEGKVWGALDRLGEDFWAEMEPTADFRELWSMLSIPFRSDNGHIVVCTSPSKDPGSAAGKIRWMERHISKGFRAFIVTPVKHMLARPGAVLVDDSDEKVNKFREHGGQAILVPRLWNSDHKFADNAAQVVKAELRKLGGW